MNIIVYPVPAKESRKSFAKLEDHEQTDFVNNLGQLFCAMASKRDQKDQHGFDCSTCDSNGAAGAVILPIEEADAMVNILVVLIKQSRSCKSKQSRVAMMNTLCRVLRHVPSSDHVDLSASYLGQYCLNSLRSSARELRIGAR